MTKKIRIENADNGTHKVRVHTEQLVEGEWKRLPSPPPRDLLYPADLSELYIHSTQRLVVEEINE
jgi:hypothetical protein